MLQPSLWFMYSMVKPISAVFSSIFDTEQYLFFESPTASSAAFFETAPPITYVSMIFVKTRGGAAACSAVADTVRLIKGSRFFFKIETTSTEVHAQSAINTASMGLGP